MKWKSKSNNDERQKQIWSDVVEPVNEVEQRKNGREDDARPPVDGVHVRQVGDFNFELGGPPP